VTYFYCFKGIRPLYFQLGLGSFLIMQIGYIRLFSLQSSAGYFNLGQWFSLPIIPVLIYVIGFLAFLLPLISAALYIPVSLYALALGAMLYSAYLRKKILPIILYSLAQSFLSFLIAY
jgi:uncharacterized membrane protein YhhN